MIPEQFLEMTRAYRLLSELEPKQLRKLLPLAEEKHFGTGRLIFREGDKSSFLHLIVSGEVALEMDVNGQAVRRPNSCMRAMQWDGPRWRPKVTLIFKLERFPRFRPWRFRARASARRAIRIRRWVMR